MPGKEVDAKDWGLFKLAEFLTEPMSENAVRQLSLYHSAYQAL